jgi:hypothetical protein
VNQDAQLRDWARRHFVGGEQPNPLLHPISKAQWEAMEQVAQHMALNDTQVKAMTVDQLLTIYHELP